jgi:hypothetical protein
MTERELIMRLLKAVGVLCCVLVLNQHVTLDWWEGALLGFGIMLILD